MLLTAFPRQHQICAFPASTVYSHLSLSVSPYLPPFLPASDILADLQLLSPDDRRTRG